MTKEFVPMTGTVEVQFGNPSDIHGYRICKAELLGERKGSKIPSFLVKDGKTYGIATIREKRGRLNAFYHCTLAITESVQWNKAFIARNLGVPVEALV